MTGPGLPLPLCHPRPRLTTEQDGFHKVWEGPQRWCGSGSALKYPFGAVQGPEWPPSLGFTAARLTLGTSFAYGMSDNVGASVVVIGPVDDPHRPRGLFMFASRRAEGVLDPAGFPTLHPATTGPQGGF